MKILFDHQIFSSQRFGGISRYHVELIKNLDVQWDIPVFFSNNFYLKEIKKVPEFLPSKNFQGKNRILEIINRIKSLSALCRGDFDIFHPTFYGTYALPFLKNRPLVMTLHDMIHDRFDDLPAAKWEKREKYAMAQAASAIIVPSKFTADELMSLYGISAKKIHVVCHGGPDWRSAPQMPVENRFLFVGGRTYYKNFSVVLEALKLVPESTLCVVGNAFSESELQMIENLGIRDRIKVIKASDDELVQLYASSSALIFSSKMEGFGLPVLEAFAANCPVICSDIPVFHEVGGDAALYFDPENPASLADAMRQNMKHRSVSNLAGQLSRFTWKKCASQTLEVYQSVL